MIEADPTAMATWLARIGSGSAAINRPATEPLFQTSVYDFADLDEMEAVWTGEQPGHVYGRFGLPNTHSLEVAVARLEAAPAALVCASGMGALSAALLTVLEQDAHVVAARGLYGGTASLLNQELARFGVETTDIDATDLAAVEQAITPRTRLLLVESLSNPLLNLVDLPQLVGLARRSGLRVLVDNTIATPWLFQPYVLGADLVMHSVTKFLGGHNEQAPAGFAGLLSRPPVSPAVRPGSPSHAQGCRPDAQF